MSVRSAWEPAFLLLVLTLPLAPARAADLSFDGQAHVFRHLLDPVGLHVSGSPGAQVFRMLDLAPGPVLFQGQNLPLGFSASLSILELGALPAGGELVVSARLPADPGLIDQTLYVVGALVDGGGVQFTSGALLSMVERDEQLAGNPLPGPPFFEHVAAFDAGAPIRLAVDPARHPGLVGASADLYLVASRSAVQWDADPSLIDVSADGVESVTLGATLLDNLFELDPGSLSGDAGDGLGVPYDVVVDLDGDGLLGADDLIDGYGDQAGLYVVADTTQPGPHAVTELLYSGGPWLGQDLYYPTDIASMGQLPLIVVSHGNGHNYQWYDHIGEHMASYGFVVMSHQNNTQPGIETASLTTLTNTDYLLGNLDLIAEGELQGHVDGHDIAWIGHSRGGEGVVRAYDRLVDGYQAQNFSLQDIVLVSSMAPTDFLGPDKSNPHDVPYHLWVGGADGDVTGCANNDIAQSYHLLDRAEGRSLSIELHGVGHGDFHDSSGSVAIGPCKLGKANTHTVMRGYMLPLFSHFQRGNVPASDYFWRQYESFHPPGVPADNPCLVIDLQDKPGSASAPFMIDDFQDGQGDLSHSSSGGLVSGDVQGRVEGRLDDENKNFTTSPLPFNGFTQAGAQDDAAGTVFAWNAGADASLRFELVPAARNARLWDALSFRAAQATRHALTTAELGDLSFTVTLEDHLGAEASLSIGAWGGGIEEPYQRGSCGVGFGWGNEFETVLMPLADFESLNPALDLGNLAAVRFDFGASFGSEVGRLGFDDLMFRAR